MIGVMRSKWGPLVIGGVIGMVTLVFVFYGIFVPGSGSRGPGVAGEVNGETISYTEFSRALNQRIEFLKGLMGGKVSEAQLEQFRISESVFNDLAQRKVFAQIAEKEGFYPSAEEIRDEILKQEVFRKEGRFDKVLYRNLLQANALTPVRYEEIVGRELMDRGFREFLLSMVRVTPAEVERELRVSREKRKFKYVYVDHESVRKLLPKDMKPEEQSAKLDEKVAGIEKQVIPALSSGGPVGYPVKTSDWLTARSNVIPGVGSIASIQSGLFAMKKGESARKFTLPGGTLFAVASASDPFDPASASAKDRQEVRSRLSGEKQNDLLRRFSSAFMKEAKVSRNDDVVTRGKGAPMPVTFDQ